MCVLQVLLSATHTHTHWHLTEGHYHKPHHVRVDVIGWMWLCLAPALIPTVCVCVCVCSSPLHNHSVFIPSIHYHHYPPWLCGLAFVLVWVMTVMETGVSEVWTRKISPCKPICLHLVSSVNSTFIGTQVIDSRRGFILKSIWYLLEDKIESIFLLYDELWTPTLLFFWLYGRYCVI